MVPIMIPIRFTHVLLFSPMNAHVKLLLVDGCLVGVAGNCDRGRWHGIDGSSIAFCSYEGMVSNTSRITIIHITC